MIALSWGRATPLSWTNPGCTKCEFVPQVHVFTAMPGSRAGISGCQRVLRLQGIWMSPHVLTFLPAAGPAAGKSMWMAVDRVMLKELKGLVPAWLFFFFFLPLLFYFFITQLRWSLMPLVASGGAVRSCFCCFAFTGETCLRELLGKQAPRQFKQKPVMEVSSTEASSRSPAGTGWLDFTLVTCTETVTFTEVVEEEEWGSFYYSFKVQPAHYFSHKLWCIFSTSAGRQLELLNFLLLYLWILPSQDRWQHMWGIYWKTKELQDLEFRLAGLSQLSPLRREGGTAFLKWHCNYTCIFNQKCISV